MKITTFKCDICGKEFTARDEKGAIQAVGGMSGFYYRMIPDKNGELKKVLMQYDFDFCPKCNKKLVDRVLELQKNKK